MLAILVRRASSFLFKKEYGLTYNESARTSYILYSVCICGARVS